MSVESDAAYYSSLPVVLMNNGRTLSLLILNHGQEDPSFKKKLLKYGGGDIAAVEAMG